MSGVGGRLVVVTGAAGTAGRPATRALADDGARVVAVGQSPERLSELAAQIPGLAVEIADLGDPSSVLQLARRIHAGPGPVDGIVHLVGGFRVGATFGANTDADWRFLDNGLTQTLRHVTLAFHDDRRRMPPGRHGTRG